ncbi:hypothetical protein KPL71_011253 [Citrus sinensis]|uniref:Uncharacterized protein n=1 Tax=Citrus sinensis TaxID=2711 RepID=A0ACB8L211_CITSI|nr:hypothetical protein KPL71_011253 [Citrus sinensis]
MGSGPLVDIFCLLRTRDKLCICVFCICIHKVTVIAMTVSSSLGRRRLLAEINSFIAVFILAGQLSLTGHILSVGGITVAICSAPFIAFSNMIAVAIWPTWVTVAFSETIRKVVTYVVNRPGRELLFTVVSQEEKYKAKACIDILIQRLGDASAAGMYKLLFSTLHGRTSTVSQCALPICLFIMDSYSVPFRTPPGTSSKAFGEPHLLKKKKKKKKFR